MKRLGAILAVIGGVVGDSALAEHRRELDGVFGNSAASIESWSGSEMGETSGVIPSANRAQGRELVRKPSSTATQTLSSRSIGYKNPLAKTVRKQFLGYTTSPSANAPTMRTQPPPRAPAGAPAAETPKLASVDEMLKSIKVSPSVYNLPVYTGDLSKTTPAGTDLKVAPGGGVPKSPLAAPGGESAAASTPMSGGGGGGGSGGGGAGGGGAGGGGAGAGQEAKQEKNENQQAQKQEKNENQQNQGQKNQNQGQNQQGQLAQAQRQNQDLRTAFAVAQAEVLAARRQQETSNRIREALRTGATPNQADLDALPQAVRTQLLNEYLGTQPGATEQDRAAARSRLGLPSPVPSTPATPNPPTPEQNRDRIVSSEEATI